MQNHKTAKQAWAEAFTDAGVLRKGSSSFICPFADCRTLATHVWGKSSRLDSLTAHSDYVARDLKPSSHIVAALCHACGKEVIFIDGMLTVPYESEAPGPAADLPEDLIDDFEEARRVMPVSVRGAAALLRLLVQKLLPRIGAEEADINKMIGQLMREGKINPKLQEALDTVRIIGNEAVHPGTMDLKDNEATAISLFKLINYIVEKAITEPKEIAEIYATLPESKRDGVVKRDQPAS